MPKRSLFLLLFIILAYSQCRTKSPELLEENNLLSQFFTVTAGHDTVLHTAKGAIIHIPENAFNTSAGVTVNLEIKEAYTIADMMLAGLSTKAGEEPLSSGGMVYINPVDNNSVSIVNPISISIPTAYQQPGMQLFKGEKTADGYIDWTNPVPLPKQELSKHLQEGRMLFSGNCQSCHNPLKDATGPRLALLDKRRDSAWLTDFIHNSSKLIADGDKYANCLYEHWGKTQMTAFPAMTSKEIQAIFDYVDYECHNIDPATIPDFKKSIDSCVLYNKIKDSLTREKEQLISGNGERIVRKAMQPPASTVTNALVKPQNLVVPETYEATYYQFTIQTFGWYNIDILMKGLPGFENSQLMVRLIGQYKSEVTLYLVLPDRKILLPGGKLKGKNDEYGFYTDDAMIPLPQNIKAYILAMAESNGNIYFGKTEFTTGLKQSPEIEVFVTTREQMDITIRKLDIADLNITAADAKNAGSLRKIDTTLNSIEYLKPKDCNCNCGVNSGSDSDVREVYPNMK